MRVAIARNNDHMGVINRFGQSCREEYDRNAVDRIVAALQEGGHETLLCEADKGLLATLERFMPPDPQAPPAGIVFNLANGIQGSAGCPTFRPCSSWRECPTLVRDRLGTRWRSTR